MEKENNLYDNLMIRILDNTATKEEQKTFGNWLKENPKHQKEYEDLKKIWLASADIKALKGLDVDADLANVKAKANPKVTKVVSFSFLRKIAAVILPLVALLSVLLFYFNSTDSNAPIVLNDGTKVWLYQDAQLDYPNIFEGATRLVKLKGEAYFEVVRDAQKPFIIDAGAIDIKVLGTSFNVRSSNSTTEVIVNTGKVQLIAKNVPTQMVELTKGEKGNYKNGQVTESINTNKNYRSWHTGIFEFDGSISITEALEQLSKYYGRLDVSISVNPNCSLKATFEKEELHTVLEVIKESCQLE